MKFFLIGCWIALGILLSTACTAQNATPTSLPTRAPTRVPLFFPTEAATPVLPSETPTRRPTRDFNAPETPELISESQVATSDLAASHNGKWIAWTDRRVVLIEDVENLYVTGNFAMPENITAIAFHPNAKTLAIGFENGVVREIETGTGKIVRERELVRDTGASRVKSLAYNGDGTKLAAGVEGYYQGGQGSVAIWMDESAKPTQTVPSYGAVTRVLFAPETDTLYFSSAANSCSRGGGGIFAWDGKGAVAREVFTAHGNTVVDFAIHPQAAELASVGQIASSRCTGNSIVSLVDSATGQVQQQVAPTDPQSSDPTLVFDAQSAAFSPDGALLAVGDANGRLQIWDLTNEKFVTTLDADVSPTLKIYFLSKKMIVYATQESAIRVYRLP